MGLGAQDGGASGVVEDQAQGVAATGADGADAVPDRGRGPAAGGAERAVAGGEDQAAALLEHGGGAAGLGAGPLLDQQELTAGVVGPISVQADDDLQREHQVAEQVPVQGVPVPGPVAQQDLRALGLPGPVAQLQPLLQRVGPGGGAAETSGPGPGDHEQVRIEGLAQRADGLGQVVGEVTVLAGAEAVPGHVDGGPEQLRAGIQPGQLPALVPGQEPRGAGAADG